MKNIKYIFMVLLGGAMYRTMSPVVFETDFVLFAI